MIRFPQPRPALPAGRHLLILLLGGVAVGGLGACSGSSFGVAEAGAGLDAGGAPRDGGAVCASGAMEPSPDGCNTCSCFHGQWTCTERACAVCADGDTKPAGDGCNTCSCSVGQWVCTTAFCQPKCPAPAPAAADAGVCSQVVTYAKDPTTGACCKYSTPCEAPSGWQQYTSSAACGGTVQACIDGALQPAGDGCNTCSCSGGQWACTTMACASCPAPGTDGGVCTQVLTYAKDPGSGTCCTYSTPCDAPAGWKTFTSAQQCQGIVAVAACKADYDCWLMDDYCGACTCLALSVSEPAPTCTGTVVTCVAAPCAGKTAKCVSGECIVSP